MFIGKDTEVFHLIIAKIGVWWMVDKIDGVARLYFLCVKSFISLDCHFYRFNCHLSHYLWFVLRKWFKHPAFFKRMWRFSWLSFTTHLDMPLH